MAGIIATQLNDEPRVTELIINNQEYFVGMSQADHDLIINTDKKIKEFQTQIDTFGNEMASFETLFTSAPTGVSASKNASGDIIITEKQLYKNGNAFVWGNGTSYFLSLNDYVKSETFEKYKKDKESEKVVDYEIFNSASKTVLYRDRLYRFVRKMVDGGSVAEWLPKIDSKYEATDSSKIFNLDWPIDNLGGSNPFAIAKDWYVQLSKSNNFVNFTGAIKAQRDFDATGKNGFVDTSIRIRNGTKRFAYDEKTIAGQTSVHGCILNYTPVYSTDFPGVINTSKPCVLRITKDGKIMLKYSPAIIKKDEVIRFNVTYPSEENNIIINAALLNS